MKVNLFVVKFIFFIYIFLLIHFISVCKLFIIYSLA